MEQKNEKTLNRFNSPRRRNICLGSLTTPGQAKSQLSFSTTQAMLNFTYLRLQLFPWLRRL